MTRDEQKPSTVPDFRRIRMVASSALFNGLDPICEAQIAACLESMPVEAGTTICRAGDPGDCLYIIATGSFGVFASCPESNCEVRIATCLPGDCFGEMALLTGEPRSATVRADEAGELLKLDRDYFLDLLKRRPEVTSTVMAILCSRLRSSDKELAASNSATAAILGHVMGQLPSDQRLKLLEVVDRAIGQGPPDRSVRLVPSGARSGPLSPRECEVAVLVSKGLTNSEIAAELVISARTAETHVNNILSKLGFSSRTQIAAWATVQGLAHPPKS